MHKQKQCLPCVHGLGRDRSTLITNYLRPFFENENIRKALDSYS